MKIINLSKGSIAFQGYPIQLEPDMISLEQRFTQELLNRVKILASSYGRSEIKVSFTENEMFQYSKYINTVPDDNILDRSAITECIPGYTPKGKVVVDPDGVHWDLDIFSDTKDLEEQVAKNTSDIGELDRKIDEMDDSFEWIDVLNRSRQ